jgi:aspartate beta-hydroxylase
MISAAEAQQLLRQGRVDEAERAFRALLEVEPHNVEALNIVGLIALRDDDVPRALELLQRAAARDPAEPMTQHNLGLAREAGGDLDGAIACQQRAVQLVPGFLAARLHLGRVLELAGRAAEAAVQYARVLQDAQAQGRWLNPDTTPVQLRGIVEHAVLFVRQHRREAFARLFAPLQARFGSESMQRVHKALRIYFNEEAPAYADPRQQPSFFYFPDLPTSAYFDRSLFPWIAELEAQTEAIRAELLNLLPSERGRERVFTSDEIEQHNLRGLDTPPSWNGYYFYRHGVARADNRAACPVTAAALDKLPLAHIREHGPEVLYSVFTPGTHLLPHRGVTNTRLVSHLPLLVPEDCALSVGGELHHWQEGRVVVFDDTFEHEAWNRSRKTRVVMIYDLWNPYLSEAERAAVTDLVADIGDFRESVESLAH